VVVIDRVLQLDEVSPAVRRWLLHEHSL